MHINRLTILYVIYKSRKRKDNKAPISCRITYLNKRKEFATGYYISPKNWDSKNQLVKPPEIDNNLINTQLSLIKTKLSQAFLFLQVNQVDFDVEDVFRQYKGENVKIDVGVYEVYVLF